jgi:hypothetical protein
MLTLYGDLNEEARLSCYIRVYDIIGTGDILWPILIDRRKFNCSVKITESRVYPAKDAELGS